jgi:hypothetical protein
MSPGSFEGAVMRVTPHDQEDVEVMKSEETYQGYVDNSENYGNVPFKDKLNPSSSWAIPFRHRPRVQDPLGDWHGLYRDEGRSFLKMAGNRPLSHC